MSLSSNALLKCLSNSVVATMRSSVLTFRSVHESTGSSATPGTALPLERHSVAANFPADPADSDEAVARGVRCQAGDEELVDLDAPAVCCRTDGDRLQSVGAGVFGHPSDEEDGVLVLGQSVRRLAGKQARSTSGAACSW